tara:strand:- start:7266 stop:9194 length:1929 start_codon:yes stop_codon:yes gene_type:complete
MKIPQYRRQTALTPDSGARPLSVTASPSAYAAPANAAFQLGAQMVKGGQQLGDIAVTELKQENATLLASEERKLDDFIFEVQTDAVTGAVGQSKMVPNPAMPAGAGPRPGNMMLGPRETQQQHLQRYRASIERQAAAQAARLRDRDVARRFRASASQKLRTALPGIQTQLRTRYLDDHRAQMKGHVVAQRRSLERHPFGGSMHNQIVDRTEEFIRLLGVENGETQQNIEKEVRQFRSDVVEDHIMREALIYSEMKTPDAAKQLQREIANYASATSPYRDLLPDAAAKLQKTLSEQHRIDSRRLVADEEKRERDGIKALKAGSAAEVKFIQQEIQKARSEGRPPNFTAAQIRNNPQILPTKKQPLINELTGDDGVYNKTAAFEYKGLIRDAVTEDDLLDVERLIEADHDNNIIGNTLKLELDDYIEKRKTKTPEYEEQERYRKVVKNSLGLNIFADAFSGTFGKDGSRNAQRAMHLDRYEILLDEGKRPAEAAFTVIAGAVEENKKVAQDILRQLPPQVSGFLKQENNTFKDVTLNDIDELKNKWRAMFRGELPKVSDQATPRDLATSVREKTITRADRLRARELFAVESRINAIQDLLIRPEEEDDDKNGDTDGDTDSNFFSKFFGFGSSSSAAPGASVNNR